MSYVTKPWSYLSSWLDNFMEKHKNWELTHHKPEIFISCQWSSEYTPSKRYALYRWVWAILFPVFTVWAFISRPSAFKCGDTHNYTAYLFIYLTNWGIILLCADTVLQAALVTHACIWHYKQGLKMNTFYKISWGLETVSNDLALIISFVYWSVAHQYATEGWGSIHSVGAHLLNSVYVFINVCITARPVRLLHVIYTFLVAGIYVIFSVFYHVAGGINPVDCERYIYSFLNWNTPLVCFATVFIVFNIIILIHLLHYACHLLKQKLWRKIYGGKGLLDHVDVMDKGVCPTEQPVPLLGESREMEDLSSNIGNESTLPLNTTDIAYIDENGEDV